MQFYQQKYKPRDVNKELAKLNTNYAKDWMKKNPNRSMIRGAGGHGNPFLSFGKFDDTGLKAYWKFDEVSGDLINLSQSAADLGSAADGQNTGVTYSQSGKIGNSYLYDGVNDFTVIGSSLSQFNFLHNSTAKFTIAFWMKFVAQPALSDFSVIMATQTIAGWNVAGMTLMQSRSAGDVKKLIFQLTNDAGFLNMDWQITDYIPDLTDWHFYCWTYDASLGSSQGNVTRDNANALSYTNITTTPNDVNAGQIMNIGRNPASSAFANMYLDEVSVWNRILTANEITALYNGGAGKAIY